MTTATGGPLDGPPSAQAIPNRLNLGCGRNKRADCLNVDIREGLEPDLAWDLNRRPYPLPRNHFDHIYALDVVEHLDSVVDFVEECYSLLRPNGILEVTTPHYSCSNSFTDPTHRHHLGHFSFGYLTDSSLWNFQTSVHFEVVQRILAFYPGRLTGLISRLANRFPQLYEKRFAWVIPAWFLIFKFRAIRQLFR